MHTFAKIMVVAPLALTACLPVKTYYREGVSVTRLDRDTLQCEVKALKAAPVANQTRVEPPQYVPPREVCDNTGKCTVRPGFFLPPETYTVDVNRSLRQRVEKQCMADRGYAPVELPACPDRVARTASTVPQSTLPRLNANSCAVRLDDGTFKVFTKSG